MQRRLFRFNVEESVQAPPGKDLESKLLATEQISGLKVWIFLTPDTGHLAPEKKRTARKLAPAGCPVDWLGLTEAVTLVAPRSLRCLAQRVPGGSAHTHGLFARDVPDFPDQRVLRNSP